MMMTIKKTYAWCIQHWRWLVFTTVALIAYMLGKNNSRGLFEQAKLAKDQYKKEADLIEKAHLKKDKKVKSLEKSVNRKLQKIENKKKVSIKSLEAEQRKEIEKYLDDPEKLDKALQDLGIKEV
jgi:hypothetical protein